MQSLNERLDRIGRGKRGRSTAARSRSSSEPVTPARSPSPKRRRATRRGSTRKTCGRARSTCRNCSKPSGSTRTRRSPAFRSTTRWRCADKTLQGANAGIGTAKLDDRADRRERRAWRAAKTSARTRRRGRTDVARILFALLVTRAHRRGAIGVAPRGPAPASRDRREDRSSVAARRDAPRRERSTDHAPRVHRRQADNPGADVLPLPDELQSRPPEPRSSRSGRCRRLLGGREVQRRLRELRLQRARRHWPRRRKKSRLASTGGPARKTAGDS